MQGTAREDAMETKVLARAPSGADTKKSDNGNGKISRYNKKRESNYGGRAKNDPLPPRKTAIPKGRGYDKRPRARGNANGSQRPEVTEPEAEYGSALQTGSKKGNLNHLLNFTFAPREQVEGWKNRNKWGSRRQLKYNKEQFLQANCQFVVRDTGDYVVHSADPDTLVEWNLIEQVRIQSHEVPNCPICLFPPVAAKMTRCGHIYCWPCILHYLALGEKSWRKCPICYEAVHTKDLKSVVARKTQEHKVGDQITMVLMKRERGTTYAMPKKQWEARDAKPHNVDDAVDTRFAKLLSATASQVQCIIDDERTLLETQLREEGDQSIESSFVTAALDLLKVRETGLKPAQEVEANIKSITEGLEMQKTSEAEGALGNIASVVSATRKEPLIKYLSAFDDEIIDESMESSQQSQPDDGGSDIAEASFVETQSPEADTRKQVLSESGESTEGLGLEEAVESLAIPSASPEAATPAVGEGSPPAGGSADSRKARGRGSKMTDVYYFYQAEDGQHIYINSLNARCLVREYGSLENSPATITANIVELESVSMTEELRRKLKYLSHLPLTCEFKVAELALRPPVLSNATLKAFSEEIEKRRRARQRKARQEKRVGRKMKEADDRKEGIYPGLHAKLTSSRHFPAPSSQASSTEGAQAPSTTPSSGASTPFGSPPAVNLNPFAMEFHPGSPYTPSSLDDGHQTATVSFAQMLRQGKAKPPEAWPKAKPAADAEAPKVIKARADSDESDPEDCVPVPTFQASFGDAIQQALDKYSQSPDVSSASGTGNKKKKKQKKLLFTTSMARK